MYKQDADLTEANYKEILSARKEWKKFYLPKLESKKGEESSGGEGAKDAVLKVDSLTVPQLFAQLGSIDEEILQRGGLEAYQSASIHGQTSNRGGDSSKKLIEWLEKEPYKQIIACADASLSALEIGCLNPLNYISTSGIFANVAKIDLNSQSPHILQQNFMERPLPKLDKERFNLILCSLVLNFVPTPKERGDMLRRITKFLLPGGMSSLFFVLPLPCLQNSRYMDKEIFEKMMSDLGFKKSNSYEATKIIYYLFDWDAKNVKKNVKYSKKQIYDGPKRNNFSIILE